MRLSLTVQETNELRAQLGLKLITENDDSTANPQHTSLRQRIEESKQRALERELEKDHTSTRNSKEDTEIVPTPVWIKNMERKLRLELGYKYNELLDTTEDNLSKSQPQEESKNIVSDENGTKHQFNYERPDPTLNNLKRPLNEDPLDDDAPKNNDTNQGQVDGLIIQTQTNDEHKGEDKTRNQTKRAVFKPKRLKQSSSKRTFKPELSTPSQSVEESELTYQKLLDANRQELNEEKEKIRKEIAHMFVESYDTSIHEDESLDSRSKDEIEGGVNSTHSVRSQQTVESTITDELENVNTIEEDISEEDDTGVATLLSSLQQKSTSSSSSRKKWVDQLVSERESRIKQLEALEAKYSNLPQHERIAAMKLHKENAAREQAIREQELLRQYKPEVSIEHKDEKGEVLSAKNAFKKLSTAFHKKRK